MNKTNILLYTAICICGYIGFAFITKIVGYTNYGITYLQWSKYNVSFTNSSILNLGVRMIMLIVSLAFSKETIKRNPRNLVLYNSVIICTILQVLTLKSYLFGRITTYFFGAYIFLIPEIMETAKNKMKRKSYITTQIAVFIILVAYHFVYYFSSSGASGSGYDYYKMLELL